MRTQFIDSEITVKTFLQREIKKENESFQLASILGLKTMAVGTHTPQAFFPIFSKSESKSD